MSIYSVISEDIKLLINEGYDDNYIMISVGENSNKIKDLIKYLRKLTNVDMCLQKVKRRSDKRDIAQEPLYKKG